MTPTAREPETPEEWQAAVDAAQCVLLIDSAKQYGLITGGPRFDLDRAHDLITRGRALGYTPAADLLTDWKG